MLQTSFISWVAFSVWLRAAIRGLRSIGTAVIVLLLSGACTKTVGDSCSTNFDCSPLGDLVCDTAQPGGYCTVVGCGINTCPDSATCVRFFPGSFLDQPCDPETEDAIAPGIAPTNDCFPDEICLADGVCAARAQERRFCMKPCTKESSCRSEYTCRTPGDIGSEPLVNLNDPEAETKNFCGPIDPLQIGAI